MNKLNILPPSVSPVPTGPEAIPKVLQLPNTLAMTQAPGAINKAGLGLLSALSPLPVLAGIGFVTWLGADMILGGALSNPLTPQSARRTALA